MAGRSRAARRSVIAVVRRRNRFRRFWRSYGNYITAAGLILVIMAAVAGIAFASGNRTEEEPQEEQQEAKTQETRTLPEIKAEAEEIPYPFNQMSRDWDGTELAGFQSYTIPQEYEEAGGDFPEVMQQFTYIICTQNGVDYAVVVGMIENESGYRWDAGGEDGDTGYMQIVRKWHKDRMKRLNAENLLNPFQNVRVGVDYMAELLDKYNGDYEKALTAYQYGSTGAYKYFFSAGVNSSPYAKDVLESADRVRAEMGQQ